MIRLRDNILICIIDWRANLPASMDELLHLIVLSTDPLARAGLASLLAALPGFTATTYGSLESFPEILARSAEETVDAIIMDTGIDPLPFLEIDTLEGGVPIITLVDDEKTAAWAWRAGSRGVLTRELNEERLKAAVEAAVAGLRVVSPTYVNALYRVASLPEEPGVDLTRREIEVLTLLTEGLTNKAIAQRLSISDHTVKFHINAILTKLNAQSRTDAVVRATRLGLIAL